MKWVSLLSLVYCVAAVALLGVDFGTEYVKSSLVAPNSPFEIVLTPDSQRKDASGLVISPTDGERLYGSRGSPLLSRYPQNALYGVKTLLGVPHGDLRMALWQEMHPGVQLVPTTRNSIAFNVSGDVYSVEEVVAMQMADIRGRATTMLRDKLSSKQEQLRNMAVSVPGHFGSLQRQALIDAVGLTSLTSDLVGLVSDGVAVAINYANSPAVVAKLTSDAKHHVVVYDHGASAASATLVSLQLKPEDSQTVDLVVSGYGTDTLSSGASLTLLLREILLDKFVKSLRGEIVRRANKDLRTPRLLNRMWKEAERAKQVLSANSDVHVHVEQVFDDLDLDVKITREEFEKQAEFQVSRVKNPLLQSVAKLDGGLDSVDAVVLVGGASRTPFVYEQLKTALGGDAKLSRNVNADEADVQGTSMRGVNLAKLFRTKRQFDVTDAVTHEYRASFRTPSEINSEETVVNFTPLFQVGDRLETQVTIDLPRDINTLYLFEDRKKLATWDLPYAEKSLNALHENGGLTCTDEGRLTAQFDIDANGVINLVKVEAVCDAQFQSTTAAPSATDIVFSESTTSGIASTDSIESATLTESTTVESAVTSSTSQSTSRVKSRPVRTRPDWEQAPLGVSERSNAKARLTELDRRDHDRHQYSELHHELESLAYRLRGLVNDGTISLAKLSGEVLDWIEEDNGDLNELKKLLDEALTAFNEHTKDPALDANEPENKAAKESAAEDAVTKPVVDPVADDSLGHDEL